MVDLLSQGLAEVGIRLPDDKKKALNVFVDELVRWNSKVNLTSIDSYSDIIEKHLIDSLLVSHHLDSFKKVLDIGSGAGLPIIPLALIRPDLEFYSIESIGKKVHFLNHIKRHLGLDNLMILKGRSEDVGQDVIGAMDCIIARGVGDINYILKVSEHLMASGGCWLLMKGQAGPDELVGWKANRLVKQDIQIIKYCLPFSQAERCLVLIRQCRHS